jgi:hypothetical protein
MSSQARTGETTDGKDGMVMSSHGDRLGTRLAAWGTALLLALALAGDRGRAASVPPTIYGQDPLEVLELKVRPNVIIVLDSSGSMAQTTTAGGGPRWGDHPRSKMLQAKLVLRQIVQDNQDKVSFMMSQYYQAGSGFDSNYRDAGERRFQYTSTTAASILRARADTADRGFQSWQDIRTGWNTLYYNEAKTSGGPAVCSATVPAGFYQQGSALATALTTAMNGAACNPARDTTRNTYTVTYATGTGIFTFTRTVANRNFRMMWDTAGNNIKGALAAGGSTNMGTGPFNSGAPYTLLKSGDWPAGRTAMGMTNSFTDGTPAQTYYQIGAARLWNGETLRVQADGYICGLTSVDPPAPPAPKYNPAQFFVQTVAANCGADSGAPVVYTFSGMPVTGNSSFCRGFESKVALVPCDLQPPAPSQFSMISPYLDTEFAFNDDGTPKHYDWATDGTWAATRWPAADNGSTPNVDEAEGGIRAAGGTPMANSLIDIKAAFDDLWNNGQAGAATMAGPAPWQITPIKDHISPKEKTIVLLVTDGNDTCATRTGDGSTDSRANALKVAHKAQQLYGGIGATPDPASRVETYVIGYGNATSPDKMNWIAWGGSGLVAGASNPGLSGTGEAQRWTATNETSDPAISSSLAGARAACATCQDAFLAPDAATLAAQLQGIIDQGASTGDFNAQQSVTESVFEYVSRADPATYDAGNPRQRYRALVPTRFTSSFSLPGFNGQLRAYQNDGAGNAILMWNAGEKLRTLVANGMAACNTTANGGAVAECSFGMLHGGATDDTIATSTAAIKRRVYTNSRNGVYSYTADDLIDASWTPPQRLTLWPPASGVTPASFVSQGSLDEAFGLPLDTSATLAEDFAALQGGFKACLGTNRSTGCTSASPLTRMQAARREAREILLAFMMGAEPVPAPVGSGLKRGASGAIQNQILYKARSWVLADSELATVAIATPPLPAEPKVYVPEYELLTRGPRDGSGKNTDTAGLQLRQGFGLRSPDDDNTAGTGALEVDPRPALKPVMTVVYAPANDMLHAFRAGPCYSAAPANCVGASTSESGGEELWGFVPFDMLHAVRLRAANQPQGRDNHVFMLARGMRLTDVFVPGSNMTDVSIGGMTVASMAGVWRRVIWFGRGIGGKHLTALDVTGVGAYTTTALSTRAPIPLWNRGNPDTQSGRASDANLNGTTTDRDRYKKMGETWSIPVVGLVDTSNAIYGGVEFALFVGSGYGDTTGCAASTDPCEGRTFFTLDALTGNVIASKDVEEAAASYGITRSNLAYPATLVANPAGFQPQIFQEFKTVHPASAFLRRVYIGDTHGRVWKFLAEAPDQAIPFADLGEGQAVGTAVALNGLPPYNEETGQVNPVPFVHVTSGNDSRAAGPFKIFGFRDDGDHIATTTGTAVTANEVTSFPPAVSLYTQTFDAGDPEADCGYTEEALFRGTVQPATTYERITDGGTSTLVGRVFYGGTRLSLPNTKFAPVTPLACGQGTYPCRSQFDSIIYALGTETGEAAYDLNSSDVDAYRVFRDSRIVAISMQADPDPGRGGSSLNLDEGLVKTVPKPPPPPGVPPTSNTATANVVFRREPGQPAPAIRYGSTVCQ